MQPRSQVRASPSIQIAGNSGGFDQSLFLQQPVQRYVPSDLDLDKVTAQLVAAVDSGKPEEIVKCVNDHPIDLQVAARTSDVRHDKIRSAIEKAVKIGNRPSTPIMYREVFSGGYHLSGKFHVYE